MQLDQTQIAIRERGVLDLFDLALHVLVRHWAPLSFWLAVGIAPFYLLNDVLLRGVIAWEGDETYLPAFFGTAIWFMMLQFALITIELPLATAFATLYLGQATFAKNTNARLLLRDYFFSLPQLLLLQALPRFLLGIGAITVFIPTLAWPYLNEVILLERNRMVNSAGKMSTMRRSGQLHGGHLGDLVTRAILSVFCGACLFVSIWSAAEAGVYTLGIRTSWPATFRVFMVGALWVVLGYFCVVRFLSYVDLRIRNEGWEVELALRAEANRLLRSVA